MHAVSGWMPLRATSHRGRCLGSCRVDGVIVCSITPRDWNATYYALIASPNVHRFQHYFTARADPLVTNRSRKIQPDLKVCCWKKFENRSISGEVVDKSIAYPFWRTVQSSCPRLLKTFLRPCKFEFFGGRSINQSIDRSVRSHLKKNMFHRTLVL